MKAYIISKENRIANSPFFIEGSNIAFDITNSYPIPPEATTFDANKRPKQIRFILGCDTIDKQEQIKMGFPANRKPTDMERTMLTFIGGRLQVPDGYDVLEQYLDAAPWFKEKKGPRPINSRIIYEIYNQDKIDEDIIEEEVLITRARTFVLEAGRDTLVSLLRLANPGSFIDPNDKLSQLRIRALTIADVNPDFVLKGILGAKEAVTVIVSKAIDYNILNIDTAKKLTMQRRDDPSKYETVTSIPDTGGRAQKTERVVAYFESEEGKAVYTEVKKLVKAKDRELYGDEPDMKSKVANQSSDQSTAAQNGRGTGNANQQQLPKQLARGNGRGNKEGDKKSGVNASQQPPVSDITTEEIEEKEEDELVNESEQSEDLGQDKEL